MELVLMIMSNYGTMNEGIVRFIHKCSLWVYKIVARRADHDYAFSLEN